MTSMSAVRRYEQFTLQPTERPRVMFTFYVSGRGQFPYDMLRYDQCWPADTESALLMDSEVNSHVRSIKLHSYREPTLDRWSSFLWSVGMEKL
jgi:hypothetical protein